MFILVSAVLFAMFVSGGCGGNGLLVNNGTQHDDNGSSEIIDSDLATYFLGSEYLSLLFEIIDEASGDTRVQEALENVYMLPASLDLGLFNSEDIQELLTEIENGAVISLVYADESKINQLLSMLGLNNSYTSPKDMNESHVEIFAIARRPVNGIMTTFTYITPHIDNIISTGNGDEKHDSCELVSNDDVISDDEYLTDGNSLESGDIVSEDKTDILPPEFTESDFSRARVKNFLQWVVDLDVKPVTVTTSDSKSTLEDIMAGKPYRFDLSYSTPDAVDSKWDYHPNRPNFLNYTVYSLHSFSDGQDYYLVKLESTTNAQNQYADVTNRAICGIDCKSNHVTGYTSRLKWKHTIPDASNTDITIVKHSPETLNSSHTHTDGFSYNFSGSVGYNGTNPTGSFSGGVNYSTSDTTTISDYTVLDQCSSNSAGLAQWVYEFSRPNNGDKHMSFYAKDSYRGVNATNASRYTHTAHIEWIWAVSPSYWRSHKEITVNAEYSYQDGETNGAHYIAWAAFGTSLHDRDDYDCSWITANRSLTLQRPPHVAVDKASNVSHTKAAGQGSFKLLSEESWTITSDADWITSFNYTNGDRTGSTPFEILYDVAENNTGQIRNANITITASDGETCTVKISQSGN